MTAEDVVAGSSAGERAGRVLVVAMKDADAALATEYVVRAGLDGYVETALRLIRNPLAARRRMSRQRVTSVVFHSVDWSRETAPQLPELMALLIPGLPVQLADERLGHCHPLPAGRRLLAPALALADAASGSTRIAAERRRVKRLERSPVPPQRPLPEGRRVLAIWLGGVGSNMGGSVTHASGILGGFQENGYSVTVLTNGPPPPQLEAVVDDVVVVDPPSRGLRLTREFARIGINPGIRRCGARRAARDRPAFVYQRHAPFLTAGLEVARQAELPLVLEWNASEVWKRQHWSETMPLGRFFDEQLAAGERVVARSARLVAAVSAAARDMAIEAGAAQDRVIVVPNACDAPAVLDTIEGCEPPGGAAPVIGWVGSFGPWHGAEVLIRTLARLPRDFQLVMIGDGPGRMACEALADELGLRDRIAFRGRLAHELVLRELACCDLLASPHVPLPGTPFFGSPTKIFEYMAVGRPIIASRLEQIGEMLEDGVSARLVTPGDEAALAAGITQAWESPDRGAGLGEIARERALALHSWDRRAAQILEALDHQGRPVRDAVSGGGRSPTPA